MVMRMDIAPDVIFKALGDPTRLALFERLCSEGTATVGALTDGAGVSQPAVSKHLVILKRAKLVTSEVSGRTTTYSPRPAQLAQLTDWAREMTSFWESRFDDLGDLMKRMDQ